MLEKPKIHLENTRDRFMDFIGNPWNGVLGNFDSLTDENISDSSKERMKQGLMECWLKFFERLAIFKEGDFESTVLINQASIDKLFAYKAKNPFESGVIEEVDGLYNSIIERK